MAHRRFLRLVPAALAVATVLASAGCREEVQQQPQPKPVEPAPRPQVRDGPPSLPIPVPPLDRERLLLAAVRAASAAAAGVEDQERQDELAGERFVFRIRFGCNGPSDEGARRWSYDEEREVLRAHFEPLLEQTDTSEDDESSSASFAVERPWLLRPVCPARTAAVKQEPADGKVLLVQRFTDEESRATRLPETFRVTKRVNPESAPSEGLDFVLSGKLEPDADGRVISCSASPTGGRPDCIISVSIESARLQDPVSGDEFAAWGDR
jgi:hypothetical protein